MANVKCVHKICEQFFCYEKVMLHALVIGILWPPPSICQSLHPSIRHAISCYTTGRNVTKLATWLPRMVRVCKNNSSAELGDCAMTCHQLCNLVFFLISLWKKSVDKIIHLFVMSLFKTMYFHTYCKNSYTEIIKPTIMKHIPKKKAN